MHMRLREAAKVAAWGPDGRRAWAGARGGRGGLQAREAELGGGRSVPLSPEQGLGDSASDPLAFEGTGCGWDGLTPTQSLCLHREGGEAQVVGRSLGPVELGWEGVQHQAGPRLRGATEGSLPPLPPRPPRCPASWPPGLGRAAVALTRPGPRLFCVFSGMPTLGLFNTVLLLYTAKYKHIIQNAAKFHAASKQKCHSTGCTQRQNSVCALPREPRGVCDALQSPLSACSPLPRKMWAVGGGGVYGTEPPTATNTGLT